MLKYQMPPANKLNRNTVHLDNLLGNFSKLIPLDNNLFKEQADNLCVHQLHTMDVLEEDPKKFLKRAPKILSTNIKHIQEHYPTFEGIMEDINKMTCTNLRERRKAKDVPCPSLAITVENST